MVQKYTIEVVIKSNDKTLEKHTIATYNSEEIAKYRFNVYLERALTPTKQEIEHIQSENQSLKGWC